MNKMQVLGPWPVKSKDMNIIENMLKLKEDLDKDLKHTKIKDGKLNSSMRNEWEKMRKCFE